MTATPTSGAAIQRYKIGYNADEWGQRSRTPSGIPDASGSWVRYEDHIAALAAGQATAAQAGAPSNMQVTEKMRAAGDCAWMTADRVDSARVFRAMLAAAPAQPAAQQGAAYAALPEPYCNAHDDADACYPDMFSEQQMRAFADATHTLRASHGQAPAGAGEAAEHYRNAIARARLLDSDLSNLTERGAKAWAGVDAQGLRDGSASPSANAGEPSAHIKEPYTLAEIKAKIASNDYSAEMLLQHAMLLLDSASISANAGQATVAQAGEYPALVCDYCGALTPDPWHSSGMLHGKMSKHIHSCDACAARVAAQAQADSVPAVSDLPPLPAPDLRDVGTKPQEIKEFLKGYATEYARTAIAARAPADSVLEDAARLDWLEQNLFHREMDEWDVKLGGRGDQNMWVLFAPKGVQGSARRIIDEARKQGATNDR